MEGERQGLWRIRESGLRKGADSLGWHRTELYRRLFLSRRHKTQILYYYKALFTKGQFLHFIAVCKRLPDFTSICCTSDFIPVCSVLKLGKHMLFVLKKFFWDFALFLIIHSYFTMIAIELYKLIRRTELFVTVLYSRGLTLGQWGSFGAGAVACVCSLHLGQAKQGPKTSLLGKMPLKCHCGCTCRSEVPQHLVKRVWASLVYLFFNGLEVLLQGEASCISHLTSHALESISRSFLLLRKCLLFFSTWSTYRKFVASILRHFKLRDYCVCFPRFVATTTKKSL